MMNTNNRILLILLSFVLFSCEKSLVYIEDQFAPRVVANCILKTDQKFQIDLSMSKSILDERDSTIIPAADIKLFENNQLVVDISHETGTNKADFTPTEGNTYRLEINAKNKTLTSETSIPHPISIEGIDTCYVKATDYWYARRNSLKISVNIKDRANDKNYYRLVLSQSYYQKQQISENEFVYTKIEEPVFAQLTDPVFGENQESENPFDIDNVENLYLVFDDLLFDGQQKGIDLTVLRMGSPYYSGGYGYSDYGSNQQIHTGNDTILNESVLKVELQSLSKEAYLYIKSRNAYNSTNGDEFVEPVPVFTNVDGGLGAFIGISNTEYELKVENRKFY